MAQNRSKRAPEAGSWTEQYEQVKTQNGWRQYERQASDRFRQNAPSRTAQGQPCSQGNGEAQQNRSRNCGEFEGKGERLPVPGLLHGRQAAFCELLLDGSR